MKILNFIRKYLWAMYLGIILTIFDINFKEKEFYIILIPMAILVAIIPKEE